ncbi:SRPBCC family protein [Actinomyces ruminis]|uniref:SRPBCC family protein n=1 Tax=Actinomyces ruminis TaxID=1937003 RepID=A0ABX4MDQ9_9ACTO|nr:SRPBCC family protein [Actinomyces ruminis]PHP52140.1 SRPBCC family protein [Actinomyces ruminis]
MSTTTHLFALITCSWYEAGRLRHPEVDLDHLLLGLLAEGGAAAALLGSHGVTLADARGAIRDVADTDLAAIGVDVSAMPKNLPERAGNTPLADLGEIPMSARAQQLVSDRRASFNTSLSTLRALLGTEVPIRLLVRLGVDPDRLCKDLAAYELRRPSPVARRAGVTVDRTLLAEQPSAAVRLSRFVSAPPTQVHSVLADPSLLSSWAVLAAEIRATRPDGIITRSDSRSGGRHADLHWRRLEPTPDSVVWVKTLLNGPAPGRGFAYDRFDLALAPGGCALTFTRAYRIWRLSGRLAHPVTRRLTRLGMVSTLGSIARTVAAT